MPSNAENDVERRGSDESAFPTETYSDNRGSTVESPAASKEAPATKPYSIFTTREKWIIVSMIALAGLFSPLSANIYFPALPAIASAFHKSIELINLTVTVYMIVQGISPMFWGTAADYWGRRPIIIACLVVLTLSCIGLALVPTDAYWLLMLLRCIQAAGSASTIALGAGVIGDISTRAERGGFYGLYSLGPMAGPSIGPVIGGALGDALGWRSIFWFLCIASGCCVLFMILFLPETLRLLVGDGSITPALIYRPLIPIIGRKRRNASLNEKPPAKRLPNPLLLFTYPDVVLLLLYNGIVYSVYYSITATISTSFHATYPFLTETDLGLCFLATGGGMIIGSALTGKFLDWDYRKIKNQMVKEARRSNPENPMTAEDVVKDENFPIEKARLRTMPYYLAVYIACVVAYGWCMERKVSIAGPLILQVIVGYIFMAIMNTTQTLIIDLIPSQSSSVTACNNLVRCSLGATAVSVIDLIIKAMDVGWAYVLLGGLCAFVGPIIYVVIRIGPACRAQRRKRIETTI